MVQNLKGWKLLQFSYYSLPWFISLLLVSLLLFSNDAWDCYTYPCFIAWGVCLVYFFICKHTSGHSSEVWATPKNALFLVLLVLLPVLALGLNLESPILKFIVWFSQVLMVLIGQETSLLSVLERQNTSVCSARLSALRVLCDNIETMCNSFGLSSPYPSFLR